MVQFNFTYQSAEDDTPGMTREQMATFEMAGQIWSAYLKDDLTVNVHVGMSDNLPQNVIGGALPDLVVDYHSHYLWHNIKDSGNQTSQADQAVLDHFPDRGFKYYMNNGYRELESNELDITTAQAKALGVENADLVDLDIQTIGQDDLDGVILMSDLSNLAQNRDGISGNDITWHTGPSRGVSANAIDFLSVAVHELGHLMGFVSGVDAFVWENWIAEIQAGNTNYWGDAATTFFDLFRGSTTINGRRVQALGIGGTTHFSLDGGQTVLAEFATGKNETLGGDGYQASHWKDSVASNDIMSPAIGLGQTNMISELDLIAFDALGWELSDWLLGADQNISESAMQFASNIQSETLLNFWNLASSRVQNQYSSLVVDRLDDVFQMVEDRETYEGKKKKKNKASRKNKWQELWQEFTDVFNTEANFSTFGSTDVDSDAPTKMIGDHQDNELIGSGDRDKLIGKQGEDLLQGNDNDDLLKGGQHRDVLVGGAGADIFVIQDKKGFDIVRDFTDGEDALKLSSDLSFDQISISQKNTHTLIEQKGDVLMVLRNVEAQLVTEIDFLQA